MQIPQTKIIKLLKQIILNGKIFVPRHIIQILAYYVLPVVTMLAAIIPAYWFHSGEISKNMGNMAINLFLVILVVSPLRQIFPQFKILTTINSFRRELGVLCMWLSLWHGLGLPLARGEFSAEVFLPLMTWDNYYFWGMVGLLGMLVLGITSNNAACRMFKTYWKKIHYIVYPTLGAVLLHLIILGKLEYILIGVLYGVLRFLVWKKKKFRFKVIEDLQIPR